MVRDVDVEEFAALVAEHHEDEQEAKGQGWHEKEVDGDDVSGMRGEKDPPRGRGSRRSPVHVLGDGQLGDRVAEQGEFRLDAPAPPGGILASHAPDESAKLGVEPRATDRVRPGLPPPVKLDASAVPRQNGGGPDDDEGGPPACPEAGQPDPEESIPTGEPGSGHGALKDRELMAEREVFERDDGSAGEEGAEEGPETEDENHRSTPTSDMASGMASEPRLYRIRGEVCGKFSRGK